MNTREWTVHRRYDSRHALVLTKGEDLMIVDTVKNYALRPLAAVKVDERPPVPEHLPQHIVDELMERERSGEHYGLIFVTRGRKVLCYEA